MYDLFEGIYSKFCSDATLSGAVTGLYPTVAPDGTSFPFITYHLIANSPFWDFGVTTYENPLIQFSIFSEKIDSPSEILQIYSNLVELYDDASITTDDYY